jgi:PAS domain S-box-containing protein
VKLPRRRLTLVARFTLAFSLVVLSVMGLLAVLAESYMNRILREQTELRARSLSRSLAAVARPFLLNYDYLTLQQMADATLEERDLTYVVILDKEGKVAGFSGNRGEQGLELNSLWNLRALASDTPKIQQLELKDTDGRVKPMVESMVPVLLDGASAQRWGTVRVGLSLDPIRRQMLVTRLFLLLAATCGVLAAVYAGHALAGRVARPLHRLVEAATALERGQWDPDFAVHTGDEIEELAGRFTCAAQSLDRQKRELMAAKEELTALNATLEEKVHRRTAELAVSREKYRLLVEGSPDAFVLLEADRLAFVNQAFMRIFEYAPDSAVLESLRWTQVIHPDFHRVARDHFRKAEEEMGEFRTEMIGQTRSGKSVELEVRGRGVRYRGGVGVELVLADVGEKRRLLRQVVQSERLRAMGEMTAMVAHNFNNLLAVILGRTQLLLHREQTPDQRNNLDLIESSAMRAGEMVRQLQEYFGEQVDLRFTEVDLNSIIREVAVYLETLWRTTCEPGAPSIAIKLDLAPIPPVLGADPLLQDVFRRLLANAAEAMPTGGEVTVRTEHKDSSVVVRIEDQGIGMSPETLRRAFDPFFTTKGSRTRGLGLSASFGIIQRHEGRIEMRSEPDQGTRVEIVLPTQAGTRRIVHLPDATPKPKRPVLKTGGEREAGAGRADEGDSPGRTRLAG